MKQLSVISRSRMGVLCLLVALFAALAGSQAAATEICLQAALEDLNSRPDLACHRSEDNWSYGDKVAFANFVNLFHQDMTQTVAKQTADNKYHRNMVWTEENPVLHPIADNSELLRIYEVLLSSLLVKRWSELDNSAQRSLEIVGANLIEAHVLNYSRENWRLAFGFAF